MRSPVRTPTEHDAADYFLKMAQRARHPDRKQQLLDAATKYREKAREKDRLRNAARADEFYREPVTK